MAEQINKFLRFQLSIDAKLSKKFMSDFSGLVAGSRDYLKIKVDMPDAFKPYAAAVVFTTGGSQRIYTNKVEVYQSGRYES